MIQVINYGEIRFEKFLNFLMNDVTRSMDDGFEAVMKLKDLKD